MVADKCGKVLTVSTVLGNQSRSFKRIFALAQKMLQTVWGMELRELPVREKMSLHEKRQGMLKIFLDSKSLSN